MPADTASPLLGRRFRVAAIDGVPTLVTPVADLTFGQDGRVTGCATVNRLFGSYSLDGDSLTCGPLACTLLAGPPEAMDQETRLQRGLGQPLTVVGVGDGDLELRSGDVVVVHLVPSDAAESF